MSNEYHLPYPNCFEFTEPILSCQNMLLKNSSYNILTEYLAVSETIKIRQILHQKYMAFSSYY
jgi:hypothetical protein